MSDILLEVCVDDPVSLAAAVDGGADRIELCSALALGGLTPSLGLMQAAAAAPIPVYAMIRPRAGDFAYSEAELDLMARDVAAARKAGLAGVVLGAAKNDGVLHREALRRLIDEASGLGITLHRVFDLAPDSSEAIELAIELGCERILTSGGARSAAEGVEALEAAIDHAAGRISIMPGAGITVDTINALLPRLRVWEVHASCSAAEPVANGKLVALGFSPPQRRRTDTALVRKLKERLVALAK